MKFLCGCYYNLEQFKQFANEEFEEMGKICPPRDKAPHENGKLDLVGSLAMPDAFRRFVQ